MTGLPALLRQYRNYRYTGMGPVVSETGGYFNNIAVFALVVAGPIAGVMLDRLDRKRS
jgi:hypothetical protein